VRHTAPACPLTRSEERQAIDKFKLLLPVLQHPRCLNCHGGVNPFVPRAQGGHLAGAIDTTKGFTKRLEKCQECHSELPGWDLPPEEFFFVNKDARELCIQLKKFNPTPAGVVGHLENDNGKPPLFTITAFKGDRALNNGGKANVEDATHRPFVNLPPPIRHGEWVSRVKAWVAAMGDGYVVKPDCGCIPTGSAWVGTVKAGWEQKTRELGTFTASAITDVRFVIDSSFDVSTDPAEYWKSVSGTIRWETHNVGGKCRISQSGSVPVGLGSDDNPMANLRGEHADSGGMVYTVALGPWPEASEPIITWHCPDGDIKSTMLGTYHWWSYDLPRGMASPDGKTLKGTWRDAVGTATMWSEWDLHLEP
jgi:hypothetical protein